LAFFLAFLRVLKFKPGKTPGDVEKPNSYDGFFFTSFEPSFRLSRAIERATGFRCGGSGVAVLVARGGTRQRD